MDGCISMAYYSPNTITYVPSYDNYRKMVVLVTTADVEASSRRPAVDHSVGCCGFFVGVDLLDFSPSRPPVEDFGIERDDVSRGSSGA
ncbi:hypothetical protein OPV22_005444 [Ensete ventricosum]|uniref:Uncharacterized protein n=1 Tax=Ensete ventricosum TaxID=4639 RepID=A0AAV8RGM4_ENSVE|nr:hypothetical protein OPV22_005444 [Ensete ventricosum]